MFDSAVHFLQWQGVLIAGPLVSFVYFMASPKSQGLYARLLAASHGAVIALIYLSTMALHNHQLSNISYGIPFVTTLVVPLVLMLLSLFVYKGPKYVHCLQLFNLVSLLWTFFVGGMAVTGEWL